MNSKIALVLAIVLGAFAAISVKMYISGIETNVNKQKVLRKFAIANTALTSLQLIKAEDFGMAEIENQFFDSQNMLSPDDVTALIGKQIFYDVSKGSVLLRSHFVAHGNSSGADSSMIDVQTANAKLKPMERALTLKVDQLTGVAMLLKPGDYIDVYWTGQTTPEISTFLGIKTTEANANVDKVTVLLLSDVYIMALDNRYNLTGTVARNRVVNPKENYGSITVRCKNYEEAKMLIHAQTTGKLTMTKKGEDQLIIDNDEAVDLLQMLKTSRKVNASRRKEKGN